MQKHSLKEESQSNKQVGKKDALLLYSKTLEHLLRYFAHTSWGEYQTN